MLHYELSSLRADFYVSRRGAETAEKINILLPKNHLTADEPASAKATARQAQIHADNGYGRKICSGRCAAVLLFNEKSERKTSFSFDSSLNKSSVIP